MGIDSAAESLLNSGNIAITALVFLALILLYMLITEKKDHRSTKDELQASYQSLLALTERALTTIQTLRESINDFLRRH